MSSPKPFAARSRSIAMSTTPTSACSGRPWLQDFSFTRSAEDYAHLYLLLLPEDTAPKHDAGDEAFRRPLGALETGATVRLAFTDTESFVFDAAVELYGDAYSDTVAMAQTAAGFAASVTVPATPQALRYRFRVACSDGGIRYLCARTGRTTCPPL